MADRWRVFEERVEEFDKWYDRHKTIFSNEKRLISSFRMKKPVLEVGVGTGRFVEAEGAWIGVDPSVNSLRLAKKRGVEVVMGVGESLPFRDGSFGSVVMPTTLCFVMHPFRVIREAGRVSDELLICFVPKGSRWGEFYSRIKNHPFYSKARFYGLVEVREMLRRAGFRILEERGVLSFGPEEKEVEEEPTDEVEACGYVCIKAGRAAPPPSRVRP